MIEVDEEKVSDCYALTLFIDDFEEPLIDSKKMENHDLVVLVVSDSEEPDAVDELDEFIVVMSCQ
ncbi:MAG: hypothetical protein ABSC53_10000 [Bacteroidota bacterium]|jgi:hypothetical protein